MRFFRVTFPLLGLLFATFTRSQEFYVAPDGNDASPGTAAAPFQTLAHAQQAVRALSSSGGISRGGVTVWLKNGDYDLGSTLLFEAGDSGTADRPVTYAGMDGQSARITGSSHLDPAWFTLLDAGSPVWNRLDAGARGQVYVADLRAHGITDYGKFKPRGFNLHASAPMELFINGRPMTLGQWPNRGEVLAKTVSSPSSTQIVYAGDRPARWTQAKDAWLHGLWAQSWADYHLPIAAISTASSTFTLGFAPDQYGLGANRPYYAYNLLEEIDSPGEYYLDRSDGKLYLWPQQPLVGSSIEVSRLETTVIRAAGVSYLALKNLIIEASRGTLVEIAASNHVTLQNCVLRNAGQSSASIDGTYCGLDHCQILESGEEGVRLFGGDRATLTSSHNFVTNSQVERAGRISWTYKPGVSIEAGCGSEVSHNFFDDMPHAAIIFSGNNHVMAFNEIQRVCASTGDVGAIYTSRGWSTRGNVIRNNFIHHVQSTQSDGAHGIYLDDCASGIEVTGNILYSVANTAIFLGGGRDNIMRGNVIAASGVAHFNDDRGRVRMNNLPGNYWNQLERLGDDGVRYQQNPWSAAFPACAAIPNSWDQIQKGLWRNPEGCLFAQNVGWNNKSWTLEDNSSQTGVFSVYAGWTDNQSASPALFDEATSLDRSRRPTALVASVTGFPAIPFSAIGINETTVSVTVAPSAPVLTGKSDLPTAMTLTWSNSGALASERASGFELQRQDAGSWVVVQSFDATASSVQLTDLKAGTNYSFRVRAYNQAGSVYSNVFSLSTSAFSFSIGTATRIEAEDNYTVSSDVGSNGSVGVSGGNLDSGRSIRLYDVGDSIRVTFTIPADGTYRLGARVRSGGTTGPTGFWPDGYRFALDASALTLAGDTTTISGLDSAYGGCFWGTMFSQPTNLKAGVHVMQITASSTWAVADYVEFSPLTAVGGAPVAIAPPSLQLPADITAEASEAKGAVVAFSVSAKDYVGAAATVSTSPASGSRFPLGTTVVMVTAVDAGGRSATGQFNVTVRDTVAPVIVSAPSVVVEAKSSVGTMVMFEASATDVVSGVVAVTATPASGSNFPLGSTTVTLRASDAAGNTSTKLLTVTVRDSVAPELQLPADITVNTTDASGSKVTFSATANDLVSGACVVTCVPASGSIFPVGSTNVLVSSVDAAGNTVMRTFVVNVKLAQLPRPSLKAVASSDGVALSWDASTAGVSFDVKRSLASDGPFVTLAQNLSQLSYLDAGTSAGQTYYYIITARLGSTLATDSAPVAVVIPADTLGWSGGDVGSVRNPGSFLTNAGSFNVAGSGADIWGRSDAFYFVAKTVSGNGLITACVTSPQYTSDWAKAGVMMRQSRAADSPFVAVYLTPAHGVVLQWRSRAGDECSSTDGGPADASCWLRLVRAGDLFAAYRSVNGVVWTSIGTTQMTMSTQLYQGLALTSHNDGSLTRASFSQVELAAVETAGVVAAHVEAEDGFQVVADVGGNGVVGIADGSLDSGSSVKLYDNGDAIRLRINLTASGVYRLRARVRSGGSTGSTAFWPDGYRFKVDGTATAVTGDLATISGYDSSYGGCYWGSMVSAPVVLTAGSHTVDIIANSNWCVADYIELVSGP